ncbi:MAG: PEP-CTERM sorting domain-containing protein [Dechloromonas sp.]|nr:PEP-CTERM sorting domain-containing protein [Dechloromonas sp.]
MVAGLFATSAAQADDLVMQQDINSLSFLVDVNGQNKSVIAGIFNVSNQTTGKSFEAFCYELLQDVSGSVLTIPGLPFAQSAAASSVQKLFNQSFSGLDMNNYSQLAGFQIALWEATDDISLSTGNYSGWVGDPAVDGVAALAFATNYLNLLDADAKETGSYNLTVWTNPNSQDVVQATQGNNVPEPSTSLLAALGLAGLALARRRKV